MNTKFRKWKFRPIKKVFISEKRLEKLIIKKKIAVYDTRSPFDFKKKKFKTSKNVSDVLIKRAILKHSKRDRILLVGKELRTNATIASWARFEGYKRVYLPDKPIYKFKNKKIM